MKTTFKKTVSALLAVLMIVCILPVSSQAGATNDANISVLNNSDKQKSVEKTSPIKVGDTIQLGSYDDKPIKWICILIDDNGPLMLSKDILCQKEYDVEGDNAKYHSDGWGYVRKQNGSNCWSDSNIRQWLNTSGTVEYSHCNPSYKEEAGFLSGFSEDELKQIKEITQHTTINEWETHRDGYCDGGTRESSDVWTISKIGSLDLSTFWYQNVTDKIFLLSEEQVYQGYQNTPDVIGIGVYLTRIPNNTGASYDNVRTVNGNDQLGTSVANAKCGIRPAFYLDVGEYVDRNFPQYPTNYLFERDSYGFENYIDYIPKRYFEKMYCASKGKDLFDFWLRMNFGVCFGMSMTTAAIYNDLPNIQTFAYMDGIKTKTAEKIRDLTKSSILNQGATTIVGDDYLTLTDYIRYAHIFQFSSYSQKNRVLTNGKDLYDLVKSKAQNNQVGIIVEMYNDVDGGGHAVLAVGVDGNNILVDDPNSIKKLNTLTVKDDGSWSFNGLKNYDSAHCRLMYECDYDVPLYWIENIVFNQAVAYTADEAIGCYLDNDKLLFSSYSQNYRFDDKSAQKIENISGNDTKEKNNIGDVFWITQKDSVVIENVKGTDNEFRLAGNENVIYVNVDDSDIISLKMNEENKDMSAVISTGLGKECSVACELFDGQNYYEIKITGVSGSGTVKSAMTESGMEVTGLNDIEISYKKDDVEIGNATAKVKDGGEVNITVDKDTGNVQTDFVGEKTENACGYCGKVHGTSFKEVLVKFFHKIFYFFAKLFGTIK